MLKTSSHLAAVIGAVVCVGQIPTAVAQEDAPEVGERIASFEVQLIRPEAQAVAQEILSAAEVMLDREIAQARGIAPEEAVERVAAAISGPEVGSWTQLDIAPELLVQYIPEYAEIRLLNEELSALREVDVAVDEEEVVELAGEYLAELDARGVVDAGLYDLGDAEVGYLRVGAGQVDGRRAYDRIAGYRVTLRPQINGIEVANAGVRFGLLPSGELASLRFGGVSLGVSQQEGFVEPTAGEGEIMTREVSTEAIQRRFYESLPEGVAADVEWARVMYVMPEGEDRAVVEPFYVISYSEIREVDGYPVVSRRKIVGYSLTDPTAEPVNYTAPPDEATAQGQEVERKAP